MKQVRVEQIGSFEDFIEIIEEYNKNAFYRGHSNGAKWKLIPSIGRLILKNSSLQVGNYGGWKGFEKDILFRFKRYALQYLANYKNLSQIDWLVLGQHYGLPTRLLDWTENPLVALFFTIEEDYKCESHIWIIIPSFLESLDKDIEDINEITMYFPKILDARMVSQKSCFTIHPLDNTSNPILAIEDYNDDVGICELIKVVVPNNPKLKSKILLRLNHLGVDYNSLFPDLSGLCRQIQFEFENKIDRY